MKPAGIERDKQIAEMRGDVCTTIEGCVYCEYYIPAVNCLEYGCSEYNIKPYSTDISCAFDLWEEMKVSGYVELAYEEEDKNKVTCTYLDAKLLPNRDYPYYKGETEADAISGAWIRWKEGR